MPATQLLNKILRPLKRIGANHIAESVCSTNTASSHPLPGSKILNCKAVPGTLGCFVWTVFEPQPFFLSSGHVMFGNNAEKTDSVWLQNEKGQLKIIGQNEEKRIGIERFQATEVYIDCGLARYVMQEYPGKATTSVGRNDMLAISGYAEASPGEVVYKYGAATGFTSGVVSSITHNDFVQIEGKTLDVKNQIIIRSANANPFSAEGDSGAVLINSEHKVVGLLWGQNADSETLACPIVPVIAVLHIESLSSYPHQHHKR